jgi:phosphatidylserine decarboxylase
LKLLSSDTSVTNEVPSVSLGDRLFAMLQYLLPKHLLSRVIYAVARSEAGWVKRTFLRIFLRNYQIDLAEAEQPDPFAYPSFNAFFTRALKPGARAVDPDSEALVSPVDGTVSQCGDIDEDRIFQAKGHYYSLQELLGGDREAAEAFKGGSFACIYLAPYNYHRIHMPCDGKATANVYVPGALFSVNAATARAVSRVFARNERLVCYFDTPFGRMALILVGALFVGSIETVHCGEVNPPGARRGGPVRIPRGIGQEFAKGGELGRFNMGSTVVLLFERGRVALDRSLHPQSTVRLGRRIGGRP